MPNIIDLFSGVGGLSLGAARAGFTLAGAVEHDAHAIASHAKNFPNTAHSNADIAFLSGADLYEFSGLEPGQLDGLIGGPPCQGFSMIGKRDIDDERNDLFDHFFRLVQESRPKFFLAENVPGIMSSQYDEIRQRAFSRIEEEYVVLDPIPVAAHEYGAPTTRTRVFFIGYDPNYIDELTSESFAPPSDTIPVKVKDALCGLPKKNLSRLAERGARLA